ncbi:unnamed protein product, partial [Brassica oleracea var. botrytis]
EREREREREKRKGESSPELVAGATVCRVSSSPPFAAA